MSSAVSKLVVSGFKKAKPALKEAYAILMSEYATTFLTGYMVCLFFSLPNIITFVLALIGVATMVYEYSERKSEINSD